MNKLSINMFNSLEKKRSKVTTILECGFPCELLRRAILIVRARTDAGKIEQEGFIRDINIR